ncbi:hypothetical protein CR513_53061, partial [Mucuna pruriens]
MPPLEDFSNIEVVEPVDGVVLVTRRAPSIQPKEDGNVEQCENIFHTRCHINDKTSMTGHLLLGHPWKFDRKVTYDGYKNRYTFSMNKCIIVLTPFKLVEAYVDQIRIARKCKLREKQLSIQETKKRKYE